MPAQSEMSMPNEFASTMQKLVAEAEKAPIAPVPDLSRSNNGSNEAMLRGFTALSERMARMELLLSNGLEKIATASKDDELVSQFERIDEHMSALRTTESVNQRLFISLHQELNSYRDNFLRESLQKPFIRDLVVLFDDLTSLASQLETAEGAEKKRGAIAQWRVNLENSIHSLLEILHRMEVSEIEPKEKVDRSLHRVFRFETADYEEDDGRIVMRIKRGFVWRDQVLRPEEVVAKRFG